MSNTGYKLVDCGEGRRLEKFDGILCDRSAPMAMWAKELPSDVWGDADLFFDQQIKEWNGETPDNWVVEFGNIVFKLEPASNGQVGVFPEQETNWKWVFKKISESNRKVRVLNGFAHTGGSTIAAANAGADVCHLDAARSANNRARINAELSGCDQESIRWITEDALKFMSREVKRGNKYDAIILDPPAFGRMKNKVWKFEKNMPELLYLSKKLLSDNPLFFLLTSHNTGWQATDLVKFVKSNTSELLFGEVRSGEMSITGEGNALPLGMFLCVEYN